MARPLWKRRYRIIRKRIRSVDALLGRIGAARHLAVKEGIREAVKSLAAMARARSGRWRSRKTREGTSRCR